MKTAGTPHRIPSLDGLRAISIIFVLLGHLSGTRGGFPKSFIFEDGANFGVRVFFIISGYLISSLLLAELSKTGRISLPLFYFRRSLRLFPAAFVLIGVVVLLHEQGLVPLNPGDILHGFTYTMNFHISRNWSLGHLWSLAVEEQFYLLWPFVLAVAGREKGLKVAVAVFCLGPGMRFGTWYLIPAWRGGMDQVFPTVADTLAIGCVLACMRKELHARPWYQQLLASRLFFLVPAAALAFNYMPSSRIRWAIGETIMNLGIALTIDWAMVHYNDSLAGRILNLEPLPTLGVWSYSLYLWQQIFLDKHADWTVTAMPWNLIAIFAAATLSYYFVEVPFLKLRSNIEKRWIRKRPAAPKAAALAACDDRLKSLSPTD